MQFEFASGWKYGPIKEMRLATATTGELVLVTHGSADGSLKPAALDLIPKILRPNLRIICCYPAKVKARYPQFAPYIVGDWSTQTIMWQERDNHTHKTSLRLRHLAG